MTVLEAIARLKPFFQNVYQRGDSLVARDKWGSELHFRIERVVDETHVEKALSRYLLAEKCRDDELNERLAGGYDEA